MRIKYLSITFYYLMVLFCTEIQAMEEVEAQISSDKDIEVSIKFGAESYLTPKGKIKESSFQYAIFGTQKYLSTNEYNKELKLILGPNPNDNKFYIKSLFGAESYLAVEGKVEKDGYQNAIFGTDKHITDDNKERKLFEIIPSQDVYDGIGTYLISSSFGEKSYLAVEGPVAKDYFANAYFVTHKYIYDSPEKYYNVVKIISKK